MRNNILHSTHKLVHNVEWKSIVRDVLRKIEEKLRLKMIFLFTILVSAVLVQVNCSGKRTTSLERLTNGK